MEISAGFHGVSSGALALINNTRLYSTPGSALKPQLTDTLAGGAVVLNPNSTDVAGTISITSGGGIATNTIILTFASGGGGFPPFGYLQLPIVMINHTNPTTAVVNPVFSRTPTTISFTLVLTGPLVMGDTIQYLVVGITA